MMIKRKIAFLFPGQGSQYVGMGKELYEQYPTARKVFQLGNEVLGTSLSSLCFNGPEEDLKLTANTQPAILLMSTAVLKVVEEYGLKPDFVAGHSLGEYTALVAAGSLTIEDAVRLVRQRGLLMQEAVPPGEGTMAAIIGLSEEKILEMCAEASAAGVVEAANYNSPGQIVLAGETLAIHRAMEIAKAKGAKRAIILPVSGPFHSSLLKEVSTKLANHLEKVIISRAWVPVVANYTAELETNPFVIKENLIKQVSAPVLWQQSVERLITAGVTTFIEIGPQKVLSSLVKRIDKNIEMYNIEDRNSLEETISFLEEVQENVI